MMIDTQWPRFQVFLQERSGDPFQDVGSVHAPDSELALQNARDVFVRRPECSALWVVPVEAIFSRTAEQVQTGAERGEALEDAGRSRDQDAGERREIFYAFCKAKPAATQVFVGELEAASPEEAMRRAVERFSAGAQPFTWWILPARRITASRVEDGPSLFFPARDKTFRLSTDFRTVSAMRQIRGKPEA